MHACSPQKLTEPYEQKLISLKREKWLGRNLSEENAIKYDLFISYYSGTGIDFAKYLKAKLKDFGISAFLDKEDIPKSVKFDSDEWRKIIDEAILNSHKFFLLMTLGFNLRSEVLRELKLAIDNHIERIHFKHVNLSDKDLIVKIGDEILDLSKFQYTDFDDEPDLLRKLGAELLGREYAYTKKSVFMKTTQRIINSEGSTARFKDRPIIEVVIGSSDEAIEWFPITPENRKIVGMSPIRCSGITPRRKFFECESESEEFFRIHTNGFFHFIAPIIYNTEKNFGWIDVVIRQILEMFSYSIRVMKLKEINADQTIYVILRNIANFEVTFDNSPWHRRYNFCSESPEVEFVYHLNPTDDWSEIRKTFVKIFRDLCTEVGEIDITDITINRKLYNILKRLEHIHMEYRNNNVIMPRIKMEKFGFTEEEKK